MITWSEEKHTILSRELEFIVSHQNSCFAAYSMELEIKNHVANIENWEYSSYSYLLF